MTFGAEKANVGRGSQLCFVEHRRFASDPDTSFRLGAFFVHRAQYSHLLWRRMKPSTSTGEGISDGWLEDDTDEGAPRASTSGDIAAHGRWFIAGCTITLEMACVSFFSTVDGWQWM
jgi:hypothetical protein